MPFQKNISLKSLTTFRVGGQAKYFFEAKNRRELFDAVKKAEKLKMPIFVLGGGSKLLASDRGFDGLILKIKNSKFKIQKDGIKAGAGTALAILVSAAAKKGLTGLEWAVGIPGTVGGAIHGNAGAFGHSISEIAKNVVCLRPQILKFKKYSGRQCRFGYRDSVFKHNQDIITAAEFRLKKGKPEKILSLMEKYVQERRQKIPLGPSAGSIFKNLKFAALPEKTKPLIPPEKIKKGMVPAGYLIEACGLKGLRCGKAQISEKQANFILNVNLQAKKKEISILIKTIKKRVLEKFGVALEEEVVYLPGQM